MIKLKSQNFINVLLLLGVATITYGFMAPYLGIYWDEWHIFNAFTRNPDINPNLIYHDRPFAGKIQWPLVKLVGFDNPEVWQAFSILMRWLATVGVYFLVMSLQARLKGTHSSALLISLLFLVYPGFTQQAMGLLYGFGWMVLAFWIFSLIFHNYSLRGTGLKKYFYISLSLTLMLVAILSYEALFGLELMRMVLLWYWLRNSNLTLKKYFKNIVLFMTVWASFFYWKVFLYVPTRNALDSNRIFKDISGEPLVWFVNKLKVAVVDNVDLLITSWGKSISYNFNGVDWYDKAILMPWVLALLVSLILYFYLTLISHRKTVATNFGGNKFILIGFLFVFFGMSIVWFSGRNINIGSGTDRYMMLGMLGASIIIFSVISKLVGGHRKPTLLVTLFFVFFAVSWQIRALNDYRLHWFNQKNIFWQLYWRAPSLAKGTTVWLKYNTNTRTNYSDYSFSVPLNVLYDKFIGDSSVDYNVIRLERYSQKVNGGKIVAGLRGDFIFSGQVENSLVGVYNDLGCLKIINKKSLKNQNFQPDVEALLHLSSFDLINATGRKLENRLIKLFGREPEHNWCYHYQKINLALQFSDLNQAYILAENALKLGYEPINDGTEWLPFIDVYKLMGMPEKVALLRNRSCDTKRYWGGTPTYCYESSMNHPANRGQL